MEDTIEQKNSNDLAPAVELESFPVTSDAVEDSDTIPPSKVLLHRPQVRTSHHLLHQMSITNKLHLLIVILVGVTDLLNVIILNYQNL